MTITLNGSTGITTPDVNTTTQTVTGGTANGVAYLNGSKVLTTGSALTFDGTTLTSGTHTIASGNLTFTGTGNRITGDFSNATVANRVAFQTSTANSVTVVTAIPNGTGTQANLNVHNNSDPTNASDFRFLINATDARLQSGITGTGTYLPMTFYTGGSERMRIDSSGNLGLGVTPSAWDTGGSLTLADSKVIAFSGSAGRINTNAYYNAGWKYIGTGTATQYNMQNGQHNWSTAPSGTAGNAISFTQAMTLDASGNLGIGTSSPGSKLSVEGTANNVNSEIKVTATAVASGYLGCNLNGLNIGTDSYGIVFKTGVTGGGSVGNTGTERMRIDSSGRLLVGTDVPLSDNATLVVRGTSGIRASSIFEVQNTSGDFAQCQFINPNGIVGSIRTNGSNTSYATSSDYRLKENIQPMQNALVTISKLNPVTYTWKADGSDGQGFIAHELQAVVPDCVTGEKDAVNEEGNPVYQGIDTSFLVATLTKAIQEQQELINQLTARVKELENK